MSETIPENQVMTKRKVKVIGAGSIGNHLSNAARAVGWDVVLCDVAREDASVVLAELGRLGLAERGSIGSD